MTTKLIVLEGSTCPKEVTLRRTRTVVGRRKGCKLRIRSELVSRIHCSLTCGEHRLVIKDLGSSNGTFVNGLRIREGVAQSGDTLQIGPIKFLVQFVESAAPTEAPAAAPDNRTVAEDEVVFFYASELDSDEFENVEEAQLLEAMEQDDQADKKAAGYPLRKSESIFDSDVP